MIKLAKRTTSWLAMATDGEKFELKLEGQAEIIKGLLTRSMVENPDLIKTAQVAIYDAVVAISNKDDNNKKGS